MLLGVTGTFSSHVVSWHKEKTAFLQKHNQALFGNYFRDYLIERLKGKKKCMEAIEEVSKSTNRKRPIILSRKAKYGALMVPTYNGKHILFQKKGTLSWQQPNFTSIYNKVGEINSFSSNSKKIISQTKNYEMCPVMDDKEISPSLETTDKISRALSFSRRLANSSSNGTRTGEGSKSTKVKS